MPLLAPEGETRLEGKGRGNSLCGEEEDAEENPQWEPGLSARRGYILLLGCGLHPGRMEPRAVVRCPRGVDSLMKESEVPKRLCLIFTVCEVDGDKCWGGGPSALGQECSHLCVCVCTRDARSQVSRSLLLHSSPVCLTLGQGLSQQNIWL